MNETSEAMTAPSLPAAIREAEQARREWLAEHDRADSDRRQAALYHCARALGAVLAALHAEVPAPQPAPLSVRIRSEFAGVLGVVPDGASDGELVGMMADALRLARMVEVPAPQPAPTTPLAIPSDIERWLDEGMLTYDEAEATKATLRSLLGRVAERDALLRECNAVCLCGCPDSEHEGDETGEGCGHDDHECIRVSPAVLEIVGRYRVALSEALRSRPLPPEVEAAAERVLSLVSWEDGGGHDEVAFFRGGIEAALRDLERVLSSARGAKGGE